MNKSTIRQFVLKHSILYELFFFFGKRKANLKLIDKALTKNNLKLSAQKADNVIVSLTSYGDRISELKYTLYSLITQSIRPEKIIVNIAFEDEKYISSELRFFEQYGVEFYFCKNLRSYKKLLPALNRFPKACIVTCDDDLYYEKDWLKRLYEAHKQYPSDVCCHLIKKITHKNDTIDKYQDWICNYKTKSIENSVFLLGGAGVLYPPNCFYKDISNEDLYVKLSPLADDIWFWFMVRLYGMNIRQVNKPLINLCFVNPYREYGIIKGETLTQQNVGENKNDAQLRNILAYYGISEQSFIEFLDGRKEALIEKYNCKI